MKTLKGITVPVFFGRRSPNVFFKYLQKKRYSSVFFLVDKNTLKHCLPFFQVPHSGSIKVIEIPGGEENKNIAGSIKIWEHFEKFQADRDSVLVNVGGGMICDLGGFAASAYKRGIDFIHVPTTIISQADSCIGGKTGVNFNNLKNHIGFFKNPAAVFIFPEFIDTLNQREQVSGMAELFKHALIADKVLWKKLSSFSFEKETDLKSLIQNSIIIKSRITENDFQEKGRRKLLNFGHTVGHALESYFMETKKSLLHGEAVAAGILCESYLSCSHAGLSEKQMKDIHRVIKKFFPLPVLSPQSIPSLIQLMKNDKKNKNNKINFTLLNAIGKASTDYFPPEKEIKNALSCLSSL